MKQNALVRIQHLSRSIKQKFLLDIREDIRRLKSELKQLYDEGQLKQVSTPNIHFHDHSPSFQVRYTLHAVCVHEGSATLGHFWTYVYHTDRQKWYRYNDNEGRAP